MDKTTEKLLKDYPELKNLNPKSYVDVIKGDRGYEPNTIKKTVFYEYMFFDKLIAILKKYFIRKQTGNPKVEALNRLHNKIPENPMCMSVKDILELEKKQDKIVNSIKTVWVLEFQGIPEKVFSSEKALQDYLNSEADGLTIKQILNDVEHNSCPKYCVYELEIED